jgi:hypothetical protein
MAKKAKRWLRSRGLPDGHRARGPNQHVTHFRNDNDLHQWRLFAWFAVPITTMTFGLLQSAGIPFRYSPAAFVPAVCLALFFKFRTWRDRRLGKRFSAYDPNDLDS